MLQNFDSEDLCRKSAPLKCAQLQIESNSFLEQIVLSCTAWYFIFRFSSMPPVKSLPRVPSMPPNK